MKPNTTSTIAHTGNVQSNHRMGIAAGAERHLMGILTDLYSDRRLAPIREYSTNARDSHIQAGTADQAIRVTTPSPSNPVWSVQDFGLGLSVDDLAATYGQYGASTKRDSDDVNGVLGLGCKSGLTYTDTFNITSVKGGVKVYAVVTKDEDGVGTIKVLDTLATDEANGVTISMPVKPNDIGRFVSLTADFFRFWEPGTVLVNGEAPVSVRDNKTLLWLDDDVAVDPNSNTITIVMGNVAYVDDRYDYRSDRRYGIIAYVPMGSVNFTPSREALDFTTRTDETLTLLKGYVEESLPRAVEAAIGTADYRTRLVRLAPWRGQSKAIKAVFEAEFGHQPIPRIEEKTFKVGRSTRWSRKAQGGYGISAMESVVDWTVVINDKPLIVTGFPFKGVSDVAKARLDAVGYIDSGCYLLPEAADLTALQGRPNVVTWDSVVEATPAAEKVAKERTKQAKTVYNVYVGGCLVPRPVEQVESLNGEPVLYTEGEDAARYVSARLSEAAVVPLKARQVDRFLRIHPQAQEGYKALSEATEVAKAALTEDDEIYQAAQSSMLNGLADRIGEVADPRIKRIVGIVKAGRSDRLETYTRLAGHLYSTNRLATEVEACYPLLGSAYTVRNNTEDVILYINAKYLKTLTTQPTTPNQEIQ